MVLLRVFLPKLRQNYEIKTHNYNYLFHNFHFFFLLKFCLLFSKILLNEGQKNFNKAFVCYTGRNGLPCLPATQQVGNCPAPTFQTFGVVFFSRISNNWRNLPKKSQLFDTIGKYWLNKALKV